MIINTSDIIVYPSYHSRRDSDINQLFGGGTLNKTFTSTPQIFKPNIPENMRCRARTRMRCSHRKCQLNLSSSISRVCQQRNPYAANLNLMIQTSWNTTQTHRSQI